MLSTCRKFAMFKGFYLFKILHPAKQMFEKCMDYVCLSHAHAPEIFEPLGNSVWLVDIKMKNRELKF